MTPEAAKAALARSMATADSVYLQRGIGDTANRTDKTVQARFIAYAPEDLSGDIKESSRKVILSADDAIASGFPLPLKANDRLVLGDRLYVISYVDDTTRRVAGVLIAYELRVSGP